MPESYTCRASLRQPDDYAEPQSDRPSLQKVPRNQLLPLHERMPFLQAEAMLSRSLHRGCGEVRNDRDLYIRKGKRLLLRIPLAEQP